MTIAEDLELYFDRLWPIMRSITGAGVRETHDILSELLPLERMEIPSGTEVFDWTVPREWVFREAYVIDPNGNRILDAAVNTLHVVNYSAPFRGILSREELEARLFSLPKLPDAIPYVTSYYRENWGFCLSQKQRDALPDGNYQVVIDADFIDGSLTLSEAVLRGKSDREVLISTYTCHPSMANNELSGPLVAAFLAKRVAEWTDRNLTYRFVFCPETIGAITYLSQRGDHLRDALVAGYVVTCVGIDTMPTYQRSQRGDTLADKAAIFALEQRDEPFEPRDFHPTGSDERQYCSPGFNLPVGSFIRGGYGQYEEYHTSLDNKDRIDFTALASSVDALESICRALDQNGRYVNLAPHGEPNLGKRGLYPTTGGKRANMDHRKRAHATLWLCNQCDGTRDLIDVARRSEMPLSLLYDIAESCVERGLFRRVEEEEL